MVLLLKYFLLFETMMERRGTVKKMDFFQCCWIEERDIVENGERSSERVPLILLLSCGVARDSRTHRRWTDRTRRSGKILEYVVSEIHGIKIIPET